MTVSFGTRDMTRARLSLLGASGLLFEAPGGIDLAVQRRIWGLAANAAEWEGVREAVPGLTNLMLLFDDGVSDPSGLGQQLLEAWDAGVEAAIEGRTLDLAVSYGGEGGPHLREVAEATRLSVREVVSIHTARTYPVYAIGSHAGYCYLAGLDQRLFMPRRTVPLLSVPRGSLSIAGMQTGVSASAGPSGWHTIGSAEVDFFDPLRQPPCLLQPGDCIRFHAERVIE